MINMLNISGGRRVNITSTDVQAADSSWQRQVDCSNDQEEHFQKKKDGVPGFIYNIQREKNL